MDLHVLERVFVYAPGLGATIGEISKGHESLQLNTCG